MNFKSFSAKATGYYPDSSPMEGGYEDRRGNPLHTLEAYLDGKAEYVSVAMDSSAFLFGTRLIIPSFDVKYGQHIVFRVVDTGGAFRGKGLTRIDICTRDRKASESNFLNQTHNCVAILEPPKGD